MSSDSLVVRAQHGPVALLTLNRPGRRNALSQTLIAELSDALSNVEADSHTRSLVITGAGPSFCAGMDLKESTDADGGDEGESEAVGHVQALADVINKLHRLPKPTIAALNGDALAAGAGLAAACDFVVAAEHVHLGYPEIKRGLVAAIVMYELIRQVGDRRARSLLLSGEPISAVEAERWGLVNFVVPAEECLERSLALGRSLTAAGPKAVEATKRLLDDITGRPADLRGAAAITAAIRVSDEAHEGMLAFLEKRTPRWAASAESH